MLRAAKYLGVPPWELAHKPMWWQNIAIFAMGAENDAEKKRHDREQRRKH